MTKFVWMIPKFREDLSFKISPSYSLANKNFEVKLYCYLSSDVPFLVGCKHTIIHLYLHSYKKKQTAIWYRLSLLNASGDRCHSQEGNVNFVGGIRHGGLYQFERSYLLDEQNGFLVKGQLFIYFEMEEIINPLFMNHHDSLNTLSEDYRSLLNSSKLSDAILVAGTREFHVHKLILSSRSPVFEAMFGHSETKEAQDGRVEITDIDEQALELLIRFIYTGKIECIGVYALELLAAADKYQIECLKSICEQQLLSNVITTESVSDLLLLADLYQSEKLFTKCLEYINENGPEVIGSLRWKKIVVKTDLLTNVCEHLNWDFSEQQLLTPITIESVLNLLILADKHQATEMIAECVEYIIENGSQVMQQEDWKKIVLKADLVAKLYEHLSLKYSKVLEERANRFARYGDYSDSDLSYDSSDYDCDYGCDYDSEFYNSNCSS